MCCKLNIYDIAPLGLLWGVEDTLVALYFQRELGASTKLIAYCNIIGCISILCIVPCTEFLIKKVGTAIILLIGVLVIAGRLLVYSWVHQSPPYYVLG